MLLFLCVSVLLVLRIYLLHMGKDYVWLKLLLLYLSLFTRQRPDISLSR